MVGYWWGINAPEKCTIDSKCKLEKASQTCGAASKTELLSFSLAEHYDAKNCRKDGDSSKQTCAFVSSACSLDLSSCHLQHQKESETKSVNPFQIPDTTYLAPPAGPILLPTERAKISLKQMDREWRLSAHDAHSEISAWCLKKKSHQRRCRRMSKCV